MKVLCLNAWGGLLHAPLMDYLAAEQPDVLCLQEVIHTPDTNKEWLVYRDSERVLDQRTNLLRDVARILPNHHALFCPAARGHLWDGDVEVPSFWGLATFVSREIPLIGQTHGFVHKGYTHDGYGPHPRSRSAHAVRVYDAKAEAPVTIAHMHGLRDPAGKMDTPERAVQAERFLTLIRNTMEPEDALIVCGDFNVGPDSATFDTLRPLGLTELVTTQGYTSTRTSHYKKPGKFADYMLINDRVQRAAFDVIYDPEVSDHCPLRLMW